MQRANHIFKFWAIIYITDMNILIHISWFMWTHRSLGFCLCVKLKKCQIFLFHICSWEVSHQSISPFSFMLSNFFLDSFKNVSCHYFPAILLQSCCDFLKKFTCLKFIRFLELRKAENKYINFLFQNIMKKDNNLKKSRGRNYLKK